MCSLHLSKFSCLELLIKEKIQIYAKLKRVEEKEMLDFYIYYLIVAAAINFISDFLSNSLTGRGKLSLSTL